MQKMFPRAEQHRSSGEMQFVDQTCAQVLSNSRYPATEADVATVGCGSRLLQSGVNTVGDEAKLRTSRHAKRCPPVMCQHEDGRVIRRLVAPPALPAVVGPGAANAAGHVAPKNPGANSGKTLLRTPIHAFS